MKEDSVSKKIVKIILVLALVFFVFPAASLAKNKNDSVKDYIRAVYNRYSKHFDKNGWIYSQPTYGIKNKKAKTPRERLMFASYYKYRAAHSEKSHTKMSNAIVKGYNYLENYPTIFQSFEDSIAHFLILRFAEKGSTEISQRKLYQQINNSLEVRINVDDTENRAIIASILDMYLTNELFVHSVISKKEKNYLFKKNKKKLNRGIKECIDKDYWYIEDGNKSFSVHYHVLTAYFLMFYGDYFNEGKYLRIARQMTKNIRKISFKNGFIEARVGVRPIGLGAQTYLMLGLLNKHFGYSDYSVYLNFARKHFFSDKKYPNRLEFHSTVYNTAPNFHDDIGFSLAAEISQLNSKIKNTRIKKKQAYLKNTAKDYQDRRFMIKNRGNVVIVNNKEYRLAATGSASTIKTLPIKKK